MKETTLKAKYAFLALSYFSCLFFCSSKSNEFVIDFQKGFVKSQVLIKVKSKVIYKGVITTDEAIDLAERVTIQLKPGEKITIKADSDSIIFLPTKKYIRVWRSNPGKLEYAEWDTPYMYE